MDAIALAIEAGQESRLDQCLKAVADADHRLACADKSAYLIAQQVAQVAGPQPARAQVIPIGKAAWQDQHLIVSQLSQAIAQLIHVNDLGASPRQLARLRGLTVSIGAGGM